MADSLFDLSDPRLVPARPEIADARLRGHVAAERYVVGEARAVVVPSAPLRRTPRFDAGLETEAVMGDAVTAYGAEEGFAFVQFAHDGYVGYLPEAALGPALAPTHRVIALRTFLYPGPDLKQPASGWLTLGARLHPTETQGDYLRIAGGYVFAGHCAPLDAVEPDYAGAPVWVSIARAWSSSASRRPGGRRRGTPTSRSAVWARPCPRTSGTCAAAISCSGAAMSG
jgi:hypothetical protein